MINKLSLVTAYIETFAFNRDTGNLVKRSHATGFFVKTKDVILLVTNWHVVTGLNPSNPSETLGQIIPEVLKITVISKEKMVVELSMPLYTKDMAPLWFEHPDRNNVDLIALTLPKQLEVYFDFFDISSKMDNTHIEQAVGKDVFILGYPFSKDELLSCFGDNTHYYLPVWKRGSIATEPNLKIGDRILLVDSMSRPGMSGSPVVITEESDVIMQPSKNKEVYERINSGDIKAIRELDVNNLSNKKIKRFNILGVYPWCIFWGYWIN